MESEKYSWQGYLRQDGRCGIRNHILVIYTVKCSEFVARKIVENSDDLDVELIGFDGCTDNQYAVNLLIRSGIKNIYGHRKRTTYFST